MLLIDDSITKTTHCQPSDINTVTISHPLLSLILNDLNIPYTWYNVQSSNNVFKVYELDDEGVILFYNISLDLGSYHVLQLRDHLKQKLNDNSISHTRRILHLYGGI